MASCSAISADPIPWGGDTSGRIAANMGNSIFVAAYLIMVFPLTLMRTIESFEAMLQLTAAGSGRTSPAPPLMCLSGFAADRALFQRQPWPLAGFGRASLVLRLAGAFTDLAQTLADHQRGGAGVQLAAIFLILLNIPNGPLESLRSPPGIWPPGAAAGCRKPHRARCVP